MDDSYAIYRPAKYWAPPTRPSASTPPSTASRPAKTCGA
ncbi:hypothetical protein ACFSTC_26215 [Nonomuraea ferruginea]